MKFHHFFHFINTAAVVVVAQHLREPTPAPIDESVVKTAVKATSTSTSKHNKKIKKSKKTKAPTSDSEDDPPLVSAATPAFSWSDLFDALSDGTYSKTWLQQNKVSEVQSDWLDQCMRPFAGDEGMISNWDLMDQPSGLCMNTASCAYSKCTGPLYNATFPALPSEDSYDPTVMTDEILLSDESLNLPFVVIHPFHVGDIAETLKFANKNHIEISVKSTGHSYTGSSTKKDTIMLNLRKLTSYSGQVKNGSLVECELVFEPLDGAFGDACKLAIARNKPAVIRVGGGEVWNDVLAAVSVEWNCGNIGTDWDEDLTDDEADALASTCQTPNENKYHIISGAAATVGAAGGWLSSGGLSANQGMRTYGLGIDQVLYLEMVLPDGRHVRFGPSKWDDVPGYLYPQTREVTGYCNTGDLSADDESLWVWEECEEAVDFGALWYAVRGGGGGAYGVTTAVYYQLHEYPGNIHNVLFLGSDVLFSSLEAEEYDMKFREFLEYTNDFYYRFFFKPESVGVSKVASNLCSCPDCSGFYGGQFMCFGTGGEVMIAALRRMVGSEKFDNLFRVEEFVYESYAHRLITDSAKDSRIPKGKGRDSPPPVPVSYFPPERGHMSIPLSVMQSEESLKKMSDILSSCFDPSCMSGQTYILGGNIPFAGDGMDAFPIHRRYGTLIGRPYDKEIYEKLLDIFYHAEDGSPVTGESFPGALCHNHASFFMDTPQRDDWTKLCDVEWDHRDRHAKCFTFQEATLGVENVRKLESIHAKIDPNRLFQCEECVGYAEEEYDDENKNKMVSHLNKLSPSTAA